MRKIFLKAQEENSKEAERLLAAVSLRNLEVSLILPLFLFLERKNDDNNNKKTSLLVEPIVEVALPLPSALPGHAPSIFSWQRQVPARGAEGGVDET